MNIKFSFVFSVKIGVKVTKTFYNELGIWNYHVLRCFYLIYTKLATIKY